MTIILSACASQPPTVDTTPRPDFAAPLPDITAEYESDRITTDQDHDHDHDHAVQTDQSQGAWRVWRQKNLLIRQNQNQPLSDVWQKDGNTLIQKKLFDEEKRGVELQHDDLRMLNIEPQWQTLNLLFDPAILAKLRQVETGHRNHRPYQRYQGQIDNTQWIIEIRTDLMLPTLVERKHAQSIERIRLLSAYPLGQSPWKAPAWDDYNIIDFADLGDMEGDPFVKKVEAVLGSVHHH